MSRRDNIRRAKETISQRRADSIARYERHIREANESIPGFRAISEELSLTGMKIFAASLGKGDVSQSVDDVHRECDRLNEKKAELLLSHGYPADYCDIQYHCPHCSDTGYVGITICECFRKELLKESLAASGLYHLIETQTFDTFDLSYYAAADRTVMEQNVAALRAFADNFDPARCENFLFYGGTGLGKTHLSSALAKVVIEKGAYVVYETSITLFGDYEARRFGSNSYFEESDADVDRYLDCDLLIIDDLGCEMTNQFTVSCLYNIINTRMLKRKSTVISTNLSQNELRKRYSDRIISRIFGEYKPLLFRGNDVREQKIRRQF